jgi:hypothetical protein
MVIQELAESNPNLGKDSLVALYFLPEMKEAQGYVCGSGHRWHRFRQADSL